jgi:uncharacterized UBP type Zn finger protein
MSIKRIPTGEYDHAAAERALARLIREHRVDLEFLPGAIEWSCSCGKRSAVSAYYRTEPQVLASSRRHLRAQENRLYYAEQSAATRESVSA